MSRRKLCLTLALISSFFCTGAFSAGPKASYDFLPVHPAMRSITTSESLHHVQVLASAPFGGRGTGTTGQWLAAKYIANEFRTYGLEPAPGCQTFYQPFSIARSHGTKSARLTSTTTGGHETLRPGTDFIALQLSGAGDVRAEVVFAGFGMTVAEHDYDDYAQIDARGKIAVVLNYEPGFLANRHPGLAARGKSTRLNKLMNAKRHGAVGIILIDVPSSQPSTSASLRNRRGVQWQVAPYAAWADFPVMWVSAAGVAKLLQSQTQFVLDAANALADTQRPRSLALEGVTLAMKVDGRRDIFETQNVVAFVPGYDTRLKHEVVVVGAHYDHLGKKHGKIYPGADDNASGTAALLEIAQAFGETGIATRRSVLFVAFAGEELGLLGSQFYVNHPLVPLQQTVAMINLDMIGRNARDELTVIGTDRSPELQRINQAANREIGFELLYNGERYFDRSDQMYFAKNRIPVIFYYGGTHPDYHSSTDTADKVDGTKLARVARLAFLVTWKVAELDSRPTFRPVESRR